MMDLYLWPTPNGFKVTILLEELEWDYNAIPVHIGKGQQFEDAFLEISPNNKIPALVDPDGPNGKPISLFESGAILMYLAEKAGWRFLPAEMSERYEVLKWLFFQVGSVGPMFGQTHHFREYAPEKMPYVVDRYTNETNRLYRVIDRQLGKTEYIAGDYSVADMAIYPWIRPYKLQGQTLDDFPNIDRWYKLIRHRPAVQRGVNVLKEKFDKKRRIPKGSNWDVLFGKGQYDRDGNRFATPEETSSSS